ncbi:MAG TPA: metal-sulfur cluster assembly factor [Gammaproteobacteria bacterium]|nr:metal-sulfur cluster assembly factor [Gammaproteobacteria bacterium]
MKSVLGLFGHGRDEAAPAPEPVPPESIAEPAVEEPAVPDIADAPPPTTDIVLDAMHDVIDPELGYNIVDIGLIYEVHIDDRVVQIIMTMTTPGCPAQDYIMNGVYDRGKRIPGVRDIEVELIWHPPWSPQKMTPVAKAHFRIPDDPE